MEAVLEMRDACITYFDNILFYGEIFESSNISFHWIQFLSLFGTMIRKHLKDLRHSM